MGLKIGAEESQPQLGQASSPQLNTLGAKVTSTSWGTGLGNLIGVCNALFKCFRN